MKQKIRFQGLLLPFRNAKSFETTLFSSLDNRIRSIIKDNLFIVIVFLLAVFMLFISIFSYGQETKSYQKLNIGDAVPGIVLKNVVNNKTSTISLTDFRGKLLIIDFWGTYCTPCVKMMPKMDSLATQFKGKLRFLQATVQNAHIIAPFLKKYDEANHIQNIVPCVTDDHVLKQLFPYIYIPHYVWITTEGKVLAFTSDQEITADHIRTVIESNKITNYTPKYDIDVEKPLYSSSAFPTDKVVNFSLMIRGHLEGTGSGTHPQQTCNSVGIAFTNIPLGSLFENCARKLVKGFTYKNFILNVRDTTDLFYFNRPTPSRKWFMDHEYSLDVIVPLEKKDGLYYEVLRQLNLNGRYTAHLEKRRVNYLRLVSLTREPRFLAQKGDTSENSLASEGKRTLSNSPVNNLTAWMNEGIPELPIVVNSTCVKEDITVRFSQGFLNQASLLKQLNAQGLDLVKAEGFLDFMVIDDNLLNQP